MPLLISTVVMFQAQNRETINNTGKVDVFHNTTPQPCKTKTKTTACKTKTKTKKKTDFLVSGRSCPKTDGLEPHHRILGILDAQNA